MNTRHAIAALLLSLSACCWAQRYKVQGITATRHEINSKYDARPNAEAMRVLAPFLPAVDSLQQPVLGRNEEEMWVKRPECPLGNWTADQLLAEARSMGIEAEAAVTNMGGLRASMPKGEVKLSHIFEIAPFDNRLCIVTLKGTSLMQLCREMASSGGEGISGMKLAITSDGRLLEATVGGVPIDTARIYTLATLDYLSEGNDRMTAFRQAMTKEVHERPVRDIYIDAIRRATAEGRSLHASVEGRITVAGAGMHQAPPRRKNPVLTILHTNDTHSTIQPVSPYINDKRVAGKAGCVRRASFLKQMRKKAPELLLFDAGDFSQGTLFYSLYKGEAEIAMMNQMGYDAATIGNHEFDNGLENLASLIRQARFPFVCANYDFTGTVCEGLVKPYITICKRGLKIGVFGLGCALEGMVAKSKSEGVRFIPPVEAADKVVDILRNEEHCDLVVCLSHMGWLDEPMADKTFIPQSHGIDLIIGGHSHTYMTEPQYLQDRDNHPVPDFQMGKHGCYVGEVKIAFKE